MLNERKGNNGEVRSRQRTEIQGWWKRREEGGRERMMEPEKRKGK